MHIPKGKGIKTMTRFEKEISGALGEYWIKSAEKEVEKICKDAAERATVEADGAIKWNSSGNYLPDDCCEKLEYAGFEFSREATAAKRDAQQRKSLEEYRAYRKENGYSEEELAEMRAAFGAGERMMDIFTKEAWTL